MPAAASPNTTEKRLPECPLLGSEATIREAAATQQQDVTSFVLGAAMERAREVLLRDKVLHLSPEGMRQLETALDADAEVIPELTALVHSMRSSRLNGGTRTTANA